MDKCDARLLLGAIIALELLLWFLGDGDCLNL